MSLAVDVCSAGLTANLKQEKSNSAEEQPDDDDVDDASGEIHERVDDLRGLGGGGEEGGVGGGGGGV